MKHSFFLNAFFFFMILITQNLRAQSQAQTSGQKLTLLFNQIVYADPNVPVVTIACSQQQFRFFQTLFHVLANEPMIDQQQAQSQIEDLKKKLNYNIEKYNSGLFYSGCIQTVRSLMVHSDLLPIFEKLIELNTPEPFIQILKSYQSEEKKGEENSSTVPDLNARMEFVDLVCVSMNASDFLKAKLSKAILGITKYECHPDSMVHQNSRSLSGSSLPSQNPVLTLPPLLITPDADKGDGLSRPPNQEGVQKPPESQYTL